MTPQRIGSYRIVKQVGKGGMGIVYEAVHESIGQRAAVKVLLPEFARDPQTVQRFFNEARAVSIAAHPGLVKIHDLGTLPDGTIFILMEFLEGEPLHRRLRRLGGRLPVPDAVRVARQMASALEAAHRKGIVHRDLKPANVIIVPDPEASGRERAKVLDFGLAKMRAAVGDAETADGVRTGTGMILGTPMYMSPEQGRSSASADERSDVYSLGVMLYEMLAGQPPFAGSAPADLIVKHMVDAPQPLGELVPDLDPVLHSLVHAMLAKTPQERPRMGQVTVTLERLSAGQQPYQSGSLPARPAPGSGPPPARMQVLLLVVSVALLLLAGVVYFLPRRSPPPEPVGPRNVPAVRPEPPSHPAPPPAPPVPPPVPPPAVEPEPPPPSPPAVNVKPPGRRHTPRRLVNPFEKPPPP